MARKADHGQTLSRAALDQVKGALSLALRRWCGVLAICLVAWLAGAPSVPFVFAESPGPATLLLDGVNRTRAAAGIPPLQMNAQLNDAAMAQARHLATTGRLSHLGPNGKKLGERVQRAGYDYAETAENLASGPPDPTRIVSLWQSSPGHNRNMLNPTFSDAGIGHVTSDSVDYWVVIFACPGST